MMIIASMERLQLVLIVILIISALTACSGPLRMQVSQNRYDLPEAAGHKKMAVDLNRHFNEYGVTFTERISDFPVDTKTPKVEKVDPDSYEGSDDDLMLAGRYGVSEQVELSGKLGGYLTVGAKMQLSGKSRAQATAGNLSSSITAALSLTKSDDDNDFEYDGNSIDSYYWDVGLLGGYRITDTILLYSGVFYTKYDYSIHVESLAINQNKTSFSGDAKVNGINFGVNYDITRNFYFTVEALRSTIKTGEVDESGSFYGFNLGARF